MVSEPGVLVLGTLAKPNKLHKVRRANRLHQRCFLPSISQGMAALQVGQVVSSVPFSKRWHACQLLENTSPSFVRAKTGKSHICCLVTGLWVPLWGLWPCAAWIRFPSCAPSSSLNCLLCMCLHSDQPRIVCLQTDRQTDCPHLHLLS